MDGLDPLRVPDEGTRLTTAGAHADRRPLGSGDRWADMGTTAPRPASPSTCPMLIMIQSHAANFKDIFYWFEEQSGLGIRLHAELAREHHHILDSQRSYTNMLEHHFDGNLHPFPFSNNWARTLRIS